LSGAVVLPGRTIQRVRTTAELVDGQTLMIGGFIQHVVNHHSKNAPFLSSLPLIGSAFRSDSSKVTEMELMLLVTPRLVKAKEPDKSAEVPQAQKLAPAENLEFIVPTCA